MTVAMLGIALLGGCAAQEKSPQSYKSPSGPEFARDRDSCMQTAAFKAPDGGKITFGGGYGGNAFFSSGPYLDCMVARGYKADAIGDVLGTPSTQKSMGGY
jgi:hypothetical protein